MNKPTKAKNKPIPPIDSTPELMTQLKQLQREQKQQLQENFITLEDNCKSEIRMALKEDLSHDLKLFLSTTISQAVHEEFGRQLPSLMNQIQEDLGRLSSTLAQTQFSLQGYEDSLKVSWTRPFLLMLSASALTGSFLGLWFLLLQASPLALFLMDQKSREAYTVGIRWMESKDKLKLKESETQTKSQPPSQSSSQAHSNKSASMRSKKIKDSQR